MLFWRACVAHLIICSASVLFTKLSHVPNSPDISDSPSKHSQTPLCVCARARAKASKEEAMKNQLPPKQEPEEEESWEKKTAAGFRTHLGPKTRETDLRLGLSSFEGEGAEGKGAGQKAFVLRQRNDGFGDKRWFEETGRGIGNAWKQEKEVFEPNNQQRAPPPVVGWPPVRTFRKNLTPPLKATAMPTKPAAASSSVDAGSQKVDEAMFVKVNMEGYAVGRKINLKAHNSYEALSHALQQMFENFFTIDYFKNQAQNKEDKVMTPHHVLIYEDNEGDRMLVGDVPWEMFICTVKRLYIISGSKAPTLVDGRVTDRD